MYREYLESISGKQPLIHTLSNGITASFIADTLSIIGARPIMGFDPGECGELTASADALCLNTGTPHQGIIDSYALSLSRARELKIPVVLDCPGLGASRLRQQICKELLEMMRSDDPRWLRIIRGNGSEILSMAAGRSCGGSIDTLHSPEDAAAGGQSLLAYSSCVCISGRENHILSKDSPIRIIPGGSPLMARVSGFGCISTALMAAFASAAPGGGPGAAEAVCTLMHHIASAIPSAAGPASFKQKFLDQLYYLNTQNKEK